MGINKEKFTNKLQQYNKHINSSIFIDFIALNNLKSLYDKVCQ